MKAEQEALGNTVANSSTGWLRDDQGQIAVWRVLAIVFFITLAAALIVEAAELSRGTSALLMAILAAGLVHALVIVPLTYVGDDGKSRDRRAKPRFAKTASMDTDTALANRSSITAALLNAMAYSNRYSHPLSVAMLDIDTLREINSGLGRAAGERTLQTVAAVLGETLRMPDRAGRFDEESFLVILPNTLMKNAVKIAERIRDNVARTAAGNKGRKIPITVSLGVAQFRKGEDLERLLSRAGKALVEAKTSGRSRVAGDRAA